MSWLDDLIGIGSGTTADVGYDAFSAASDAAWMPEQNSDWLQNWLGRGSAAPEIDYGTLFGEAVGATLNPQEELFAGRDSVWMPSQPTLFEQANDFYAPIERVASSPLGKLGIGGLGALVSAYGANKQNKNYKQAIQEALAARAASKAQHMTDTAPMRVTNQRTAAPSWGANQRRAFSGNSLAAMTPRSSGTMYAAEGGSTNDFAEGGLCQACRAHMRQNYVAGGTAGQDDKIPAMLSDGEYIVDADVVSALGDGNNAAGAKKLDKMRIGIREHKRSAPSNKIPPKAKKPEAYLKGAK